MKTKIETPRTDAAEKMEKDNYDMSRECGDPPYPGGDLADFARTLETELVELAGIINTARDRSLDEEACRPCRWLIELPMTDAEASRFRDILSNNRLAEPSNEKS